MKSIKYICLFLFIIIHSQLDASVSDSIKIDKSKIFSYALNADVYSSLKILDIPDSTLSETEKEFKTKFEDRFKFSNDRSDYLINIEQQAQPLLGVYCNYWRKALLKEKIDYNKLIKSTLTEFLYNNLNPDSKINFQSSDDEIDSVLKLYITSLGYMTTGFGKTGSLYDLLIWKNQTDTIYNFNIYGDTVNVNVTFMDNFITLGWEEYATLGVYYPGGWADDKGLYCVRKAYDLQSENFLISYLAHEGRHFKDYKIFPDLKGNELEYRAKLTELSLAKETLFNTIQFFINNGIKGSVSPHTYANYKVISDLSKEFFKVEFETDMDKWETLSTDDINLMSHKLFVKNTDELKKNSKD